LGGNSLIGASVAFARAQAAHDGHELYYHLRSLASMSPSRGTPRLFVNLINGGKHAEGGSPIQEHQIVTETDDIAQAFAQAEAVENAIASIMAEHGMLPKHGDEGGVVFPVSSIDQPFALLSEAIARAHVSGLSIGADAAASSFYAGGSYDILGVPHTKDALASLYASLHEKHSLAFLEDPFEENDGASFTALKSATPGLTLIGDDLTTTDPAAIRAAAEAGSIQAVIIKPNQIGTLSETIEAMKTAREHDVHCIVSHRSGDTMDSFIADLAFAFGAYGLKAGAPRAQERRVKYERLIEISHDAAYRPL
jgi:enolase